jgi:hypothetical protein
MATPSTSPSFASFVMERSDRLAEKRASVFRQRLEAIMTDVSGRGPNRTFSFTQFA